MCASSPSFPTMLMATEKLCKTCFSSPPSNLHLVGDLVNKVEPEAETSECVFPSSVEPEDRCCSKSQDTNFIDVGDFDCKGDRRSYSISADSRLKAWERTLEQRSAIAARIAQRIGKPPCQLLFNRPTTVDVRDKILVQRLIAHADRMDPSRLAVKRRTVSYNRYNEMDMVSAELSPQRHFEIIGIPGRMKQELLGENNCRQRSRWFYSKPLKDAIKQRGQDIKRVLPFFPDIENLQVIGRKIPIYEPPENSTLNNMDYTVNDYNGAALVMPAKPLSHGLEYCLARIAEYYDEHDISDFRIDIKFDGSFSDFRKGSDSIPEKVNSLEFMD